MSTPPQYKPQLRCLCDPWGKGLTPRWVPEGAPNTWKCVACGAVRIHSDKAEISPRVTCNCDGRPRGMSLRLYSSFASVVAGLSKGRWTATAEVGTWKCHRGRLHTVTAGSLGLATTCVQQ